MKRLSPVPPASAASNLPCVCHACRHWTADHDHLASTTTDLPMSQMSWLRSLVTPIRLSKLNWTMHSPLQLVPQLPLPPQQ
jgi:hypothetical protein